jgi:arylsulfate sulfotransferase
MKNRFAVFFFIFSFLRISSQILPSYSVTVLDTASKGYYFMIPIKFAGSLPGYTVTQTILDKNGNLVYYKKFPTGNPGDFKLLSNGLMSYSNANKFYLMDSSFIVVDSIVPKNGVIFDGHDLQLLPNGHYVMLGIETVTMNLSSYNYFGINHNLAGSATATVKCGVIQEQDANKNVVFEWHSKNYYNFNDVDPQWLLSPTNVDWTHFNAVDYDWDGNYLISVRHFNEITKVKRSDSTIMWRMGGNANQFTFTNDAQMFIGQHDIRRITNGNISLNDNGRLSPLHVAASKEYQLNESAKTATLVWSYIENNTTYSRAIGNQQHLANGNILSNYGAINNLARIFNVVKPNGSKVFELAFADSLRTYRAFNYPTLPWSLKQPQLMCSVSGTQVVLDAGPQISYLWNTGATTQTILVANTGTYSVWVSKGQGGFISSPVYTVDISTPCLFTSVEKNEKEENISVYPNPVTDKINITSAKEISRVELYNSLGEKVFEKSGRQSITDILVSDLLPGIYFLRINNTVKKIIKE